MDKPGFKSRQPDLRVVCFSDDPNAPAKSPDEAWRGSSECTPPHPIWCCPPWAQLVWTVSIWTHDQWPSTYQPQLKPLQQWPVGICSHPSIQPQRALITESATHHSKMGQVPEELWEGRQRKRRKIYFNTGFLNIFEEPLAQRFLCRNQIKWPLALGGIASWQDTRLEEWSIGWIPAPTYSISWYLPFFSAQPTQPYMANLILVPCGGLLQAVDLFPENTYIPSFAYSPRGKQIPVPLVDCWVYQLPPKPLGHLRPPKGRHCSYLSYLLTSATKSSTGKLSYTITYIMLYIIYF